MLPRRNGLACNPCNTYHPSVGLSGDSRRRVTTGEMGWHTGKSAARELCRSTVVHTNQMTESWTSISGLAQAQAAPQPAFCHSYLTTLLYLMNVPFFYRKETLVISPIHPEISKDTVSLWKRPSYYKVYLGIGKGGGNTYLRILYQGVLVRSQLPTTSNSQLYVTQTAVLVGWMVSPDTVGNSPR